MRSQGISVTVNASMNGKDLTTSMLIDVDGWNLWLKLEEDLQWLLIESHSRGPLICRIEPQGK